MWKQLSLTFKSSISLRAKNAKLMLEFLLSYFLTLHEKFVAIVLLVEEHSMLLKNAFGISLASACATNIDAATRMQLRKFMNIPCRFDQLSRMLLREKVCF